jgi:hypothetical protein
MNRNLTEIGVIRDVERYPRGEVHFRLSALFAPSDSDPVGGFRLVRGSAQNKKTCAKKPVSGTKMDAQNENIEAIAEKWVEKNWHYADDRHRQGCVLEGLSGQIDRGEIDAKLAAAILYCIASRMK